MSEKKVEQKSLLWNVFVQSFNLYIIQSSRFRFELSIELFWVNNKFLTLNEVLMHNKLLKSLSQEVIHNMTS